VHGTIVESGREAASNADILGPTRLQNVPSSGFLTLELASDNNDATNNYTFSLLLPDGQAPMIDVQAPQASVGVLDERTKLKFTAHTTAGGKTIFSCVENGTAVLTWRMTFTPDH